MNWQIGKARCRSDEYEAEILATDMGDGEPILYRVRERPSGRWLVQKCGLSGRTDDQVYRGFDLLPPRLTLEEAARDARRAESLALDLRVERAKNERLLAILVGISALECPPDVTVSGITYGFAPKDPTRMLDAYRELSKRIREIPAAIDTALEGK
jgi:hypothetical protein